MDKVYSSEMSHLLIDKKTEIFDRWVVSVNARIEASDKTNRSKLIDHLPQFLARLAETLDPNHSTDDPCVDGSCQIHGHLRANEEKYSVREMLKEYRVLREVIFKVAEENAKQVPQPIRDFIADSIEKAMEIAAEAFSGQRVQGIEDEKERANKIIGRQDRFVASLSHDLRNPIGAAVMGLEILEEELTESGHEETIDIIKRNLRQADAMLNNLLDLARVKSGHQLIVNPGPCSLKEILDNAVNDFIPRFGDRFLYFKQVDAQGNWDASVLRRIVDNILQNALKYGYENRLITIATGIKDEKAFISIHNFGKPIPKQLQDNIFNPFNRGLTDEPTIAGWGLGLAFVKVATEAHHGTVAVSSSQEDGTTFTITLPL
ncbi:MAG TPA: sensor histidine kinase [Oligoflexus sp.]|uniref:sensor histidine kinase n=1 Tax=Oligoflexus sp. TaxID=1971216 RepID=UPI002D716398|nr:sensor histidine kinase [Oligoflexus sp.]HYX38524.1 sensor histidine kinase [Oligoflexus sp.]